ncbi:hypothetical protein AAVH_13633 [Aphelenchoides avenae]|nr:hypothetical protein AAVH_13633 [Aphelenchus avenae]
MWSRVAANTVKDLSRTRVNLARNHVDTHLLHLRGAVRHQHQQRGAIRVLLRQKRVTLIRRLQNEAIHPSHPRGITHLRRRLRGTIDHRKAEKGLVAANVQAVTARKPKFVRSLDHRLRPLQPYTRKTWSTKITHDQHPGSHEHEPPPVHKKSSEAPNHGSSPSTYAFPNVNVTTPMAPPLWPHGASHESPHGSAEKAEKEHKSSKSVEHRDEHKQKSAEVKEEHKGGHEPEVSAEKFRSDRLFRLRANMPHDGLDKKVHDYNQRRNGSSGEAHQHAANGTDLLHVNLLIGGREVANITVHLHAARPTTAQAVGSVKVHLHRSVDLRQTTDLAAGNVRAHHRRSVGRRHEDHQTTDPVAGSGTVHLHRNMAHHVDHRTTGLAATNVKDLRRVAQGLGALVNAPQVAKLLRDVRHNLRADLRHRQSRQ